MYNTRQVPACTQGPVDSTDAIIVETSGASAYVKMSSKVASEKAQTMVFEDRYIYPRIDFLERSFYCF